MLARPPSRGRVVACAPAAEDGKQKPVKLPPWVKMVAGMAGGAAEAIALQPLDTSKTRLQIDKTGRYRGLVNTLTTIAREEGAGALYKGLTPFVTHLTLKYALRFGSFGYYKSAMGTYASSLSDSSRNFLAGLAAGITEAILIVTPFERVKTVLQKQHGLDKSKLKYQGPVHAAVTIAREEGVRALWNGAAPTIARQATNQAALFWSYPQILKLFSDRVEGDGKQQAPWKPATAALLGAMIGPISNCPMDVVKTRMMAAAKGEQKYKGWIDATVTIAREEGIAALWKGIVPRLARIAPGQAITWMVVTRIETWFEQRAMQQQRGGASF